MLAGHCTDIGNYVQLSATCPAYNHHICGGMSGFSGYKGGERAWCKGWGWRLSAIKILVLIIRRKVNQEFAQLEMFIFVVSLLAMY